MTQIKNHHILCTGMQITCTDRQCHKNYQWMVLNGLKTPTFNENFINIYNGDSDAGYFFFKVFHFSFFLIKIVNHSIFCVSLLNASLLKAILLKGICVVCMIKKEQVIHIKSLKQK